MRICEFELGDLSRDGLTEQPLRCALVSTLPTFTFLLQGLKGSSAGRRACCFFRGFWLGFQSSRGKPPVTPTLGIQHSWPPWAFLRKYTH